MARRVAFHCRITLREVKNLRKGQTLLFNHLVTNTGKAYNSGSGIFTAPEDGVYVFNVGGTSKFGKYQKLELVNNGTLIQTLYADAGTIGTYATASLTAVVELKKGDLVYVRVGDGVGEIFGEDLTFFCGWLL